MALNTDVLILVLEYLDLDDLLRLASTCRVFHSIVHDFGWSIFLRNNQRHSLTLYSSRSRWSPLTQVRYNALTDRAWSRPSFIARPLSSPWKGNLQPAIALSVSTLLVAAGRILYSYAVQGAPDASASRIVFERSYTFVLGPNTRQPDIISIAFLPDIGQDRTVFLGFEDGSVEQIYLPSQQESNSRQQLILFLSLSKWGSVSLTNLAFEILSPVSVDLRTRSWASHLCMSASSPYAVFGTTSNLAISSPALSLYYVTPDGFPLTPSIVLQSPKNSAAVYGITSAPPSSPLGPSDQIIVSGWYDSAVRIYDLRVSSHHIPASGPFSPPILLPVLTLQDPWSPEPIYSVSCGGGNASFVAAGTARHGVVAFWDVRQPSQGWSVHSPGNDSSPVYSVVLESSRLFGATQSRPFVYDFGPGITRDTYPPITPTVSNDRRRITEDRLKPERNGIGYHVLKYSHRRMDIF